MIETHSLLTTRHLKGKWWLPRLPEHQLSGDVSFFPSKEIVLEVDGSLANELHASENHYGQETILGFIENEAPCTLLYNTHVSGKFSGNTVIEEKYRTRYLVIGVHISNPLSFKFSDLIVRFTRLEQWTNRNPFDFQHEKEDPLTEIVKYTRPPQIKVPVPSKDVNIILWPSYTRTSKPDRIEFEHQEYIGILPNTDQSLKWFLSIAFEIRNLLTVLMTDPPAIVELLGNAPDDSGGKSNFTILFSQPDWHANSSTLRSNILIDLPSINEYFPNVVNKWLTSPDAVKPLYDLFFGYLARPNMYANFSFLSMMQALESYHRSRYSGVYIDKDKYDNFLTTMTAALPKDLPSDLRAALVSRLNYGNEYSLRKRITDIFRNLDDSLVSLVDSDYKQFVTQIVADRNYLTHYDQVSKPSGYNTERLQLSTQKIRTLLTILLLSDLEIPVTIVRDAIRRSGDLWPWT